jgi:hypothetical protein
MVWRGALLALTNDWEGLCWPPQRDEEAEKPRSTIGKSGLQK